MESAASIAAWVEAQQGYAFTFSPDPTRSHGFPDTDRISVSAFRRSRAKTAK